MDNDSSINTPLTVWVIRNGPLADSEPFVSTLRKAFTGSESRDSYTASDYELLDPIDFRVFASAAAMPDAIKQSLIDHSKSVLIVLLVATADDAARQLVGIWSSFVANQPQAALIAVCLAQSQALETAESDQIISLGLAELDERDLRRDILALYSLNVALKLLNESQASLPRPAGETAPPTKPRLFFSHAKRDGVPLATALVSWLKDRLPRFSFFYDTIHLDLQGDLNAQLQGAVANSVLVVLRTEVFDQRYWCQKEIFWSEKHGVPVITVDGRWNLHHAPSVVAFDASPSVRIPDGSLIRILLAAMTEALRVALLRHRAALAAQSAELGKEVWTALPRFPSLVSLQAAVERLDAAKGRTGSAQPYFIVYPNPTMPDGLRDSAQSMASAVIRNSEVLSLDEFRIRCMRAVP